MMENETKTLELLEMMYQEMKQGFKDVRLEIRDIDKKVNKTNLNIENEIVPQLKTLFDGYTQHTEQIARIETKIDVIQADIDHLTIKTLAQSDKIVDLSKRVNSTR